MLSRRYWDDWNWNSGSAAQKDASWKAAEKWDDWGQEWEGEGDWGSEWDDYIQIKDRRVKVRPPEIHPKHVVATKATSPEAKRLDRS